MKSPAELASRLRKMILAAQHHYSPTGAPLRSIVVSPEWLEDMADAACKLEWLAAEEDSRLKQQARIFDAAHPSISVNKV